MAAPYETLSEEFNTGPSINDRGLRGWANPHPGHVSFNPHRGMGSPVPQQVPVINDLRRTGPGDPQRLSPAHLLSSGFISHSDENFKEPTVSLSGKLPRWLWGILSWGLGINPGTRVSRERICVATSLHVMTITTGFCFGSCGLIFNIYDTISKFTRTTILMSLFRSFMGLFWILLGIYNHTLASRLFSSRGLLEYIRLHTKTFMKISNIVWISMVTIGVYGSNIYSNIYLLSDNSLGNKTDNHVYNTCPDVNLPVYLCQIYFSCKIFFSFISLFWCLVVTAVTLSVCRTHTICLRRFMKELSYDASIYEEFYILKNFSQQTASRLTEKRFSEFDICDDFENTDEDGPDSSPSNGQNVLKTLRIMKVKRISMSALSASMMSIASEKQKYSHTNDEEIENDDEPSVVEMGNRRPSAVGFDDRGAEIGDESGAFDPPDDLEDFSTMKAPIMSNEEFMFSYFKIMRHMRSTSLMLQRWISCWIIFVMMWCALEIVDWCTHMASMSSIFQFLGPLIVLGLLSSAYAEVNFEGHRLIEFILPIEERMPIISYVKVAPLELKVYSFNMSYNVLATVMAGVALTFTSRIIIDNVVF